MPQPTTEIRGAYSDADIAAHVESLQADSSGDGGGNSGRAPQEELVVAESRTFLQRAKDVGANFINLLGRSAHEQTRYI